MTIDIELLNTWKALRSYGDNKEIFKTKNPTQSNINAVARAFRDQTCTDELFARMKEFYAAKERKLFPERFNTPGHE